MNTKQLAAVMSTDRYTKSLFQGVFPSDRLPSRIKQYPAGLIANVDRSKKLGSHWIAIYIDKDGQGTFFDSYGNKPEFYEQTFKEFLEKNSITYSFNNTCLQCLQSLYSREYGQYCLYFLLFKETIVNRFTANKRLNDEFVSQFIVNHFSAKINLESASKIPERTRSQHERLNK